jgi:hypothetical protein
MARGWESKSVEQQIEDREKLSLPAGGNTHPEAQRERELEVLELSRKHLLKELETITHPRLRELKQRALAHIETQIALLLHGGTGDKPRDSM